MHLNLEGKVNNKKEILVLSEFLSLWMKRACYMMGMTEVGQAFVIARKIEGYDIWGLVGSLLATEGHIVVETLPEKEYIDIDIFSYKDLNPDIASAVREDIQLHG